MAGMDKIERKKMKYQWKGRVQYIGKAEDVAKYIKSMGNNVTPELLVKRAKFKNSLIHDYFEWDNDTAAKKYRIQQAGNLLRAIEVIVDEGDGELIKVRAFHSVTEGNEKVYVSLERARSKPDLWEQVKEQALQEIINWQRKYKHMTEFEVIFKAIKRVKIN